MDLDDYDPNVVASLLKLYLRELPEPLINPITAIRLESITGKLTHILTCRCGYMHVLTEALCTCARRMCGYTCKQFDFIAVCCVSSIVL